MDSSAYDHIIIRFQEIDDLEYGGVVKKEVSEKIIIVQSSSDLCMVSEKTESEYLSDLVDSLCDEEFDSLDFDDELISNFIQNFGSEMYLRKFTAAQVELSGIWYAQSYLTDFKTKYLGGQRDCRRTQTSSTKKTSRKNQKNVPKNI